MAWAMVLVMVLGACGTPPHRGELQALESALLAMQTAAKDYSQVSQDSVDATREWATTQLQDFELLAADSGVVLSRSEGAIVSDVSRVKRLLKDNPQRRQSVEKAQTQATRQIQLLMEALRTNATIDGAGTPIDSTYIRLQVKAECTAAEQVALSWQETTNYATQALSLARTTMPLSDSLSTELRKRLAQWIIEQENRP